MASLFRRFMGGDKEKVEQEKGVQKEAEKEAEKEV